MKAIPPALLKLAIFAQLHAGAGATANPPSSTSSYHPAPGAEDRWVAEEEFHGASSAESRHGLENRRGGNNDEDRGRDPRSSSYPGHDALAEHSWWDDDDCDDDERLRLRLAPSPTPIEQGKDAAGRKRDRLRIWKKRQMQRGGNESLGEHPTSASGDGSPAEPLDGGGPPTSGYDEEHPMRTDEWRLDVRLSRLYSEEEGGLFEADGNSNRAEGVGGRRKRQVMQFARNGYVRVSEGEGRGGAGKNRPRVGKWRIGHGGVAFDIPVQVNARRKGGESDGGPRPRTTVLHYHADIHLNKFGAQPRMFRGVITRDRHLPFLPPNFLRPVIGTFSAEGIGRDTADTSYRERAISLSRQQVIDDAMRERDAR